MHSLYSARTIYTAARRVHPFLQNFHQMQIFGASSHLLGQLPQQFSYRLSTRSGYKSWFAMRLQATSSHFVPGFP